MPRLDEIDMVVALADVVLDEYRPGLPLHDFVRGRSLPTSANLDVAPTFFIDVEAGGTELRSMNTVLDAVQLAVDVAAVAVLYDDEMTSLPGDRNYDLLTNLAREPVWALEIVTLADGSFKVKVKALFRSSTARHIIFGTGIVTTAVLNAIFPPLILPGLILTGVGGVAEIGEAIHNARHPQQLASQPVTELQQQMLQMRERLANQEALLEAQGRQIADLKAAQDAELKRVVIEVVDEPKAA